MHPNFKKKRFNEISTVFSQGDNAADDKNELFVVKQSALYLYRYLNRRFILDDETMEFICWILGEDKYLIAEYLLGQIAHEDEKEALCQDFLECGTGYREFSHLIIKISMRLKKRGHYQFRQFLFSLLQQKYMAKNYRGFSDIEKCILKIKKMFNPSEDEISMCIFLFIITCVDAPESFFDRHLDCSRFSGRKYLKHILGINQTAFLKIFSGSLAKADLLKMDRHNIELDEDLLLMFQSSPRQLFYKKFYSKISSNTIPLEYHLNMEDQVRHVIQLLKRKTTVPTHILLYGPPGTGKTSFAYGVSRELKVPTFEISREEDNKSVNRRAALLACINMTNSGSGSLIIMDEADNVLNTISSWFIRGETQDKGWLNHLLEEPGIRMIWITNTIDDIESSVLRRFSFSIQFKPFNRRQRILLWDNITRNNRCRSLFTNADINNLAKKFKVSPGAIDLAVKKNKQLSIPDRQDFFKALIMGLEAHQMLANYGEKASWGKEIEKDYSIEGLNINADLNHLLGQLEKFDQYLRKKYDHEINNLNLLFYGPPGTGKSALARYISHYLDRETISKRLSDILDPYVGVAEKNIRSAFDQAEHEDAVLIIDEADSLLFPRETAVRSWEINFTNEFLTQMEKFKGILICTTNRIKHLDIASIRRFNQKIGFDYLEPPGNLIFYQKFLEPLASSSIPESAKSLLIEIPKLTPGDFKTVRDRYVFSPPEERSHELFVQALKEESTIKKTQQGMKPIGFCTDFTTTKEIEKHFLS